LLFLAVAAGGCAAESNGEAVEGATQIPRDRIVLERGMAGIRLRATPAQVRSVLGRPDYVRLFARSETGGTIYSWRYRRRRVFVDLTKLAGRLRVVMVTTRNERLKTPQDVHVGSTEQSVKRQVSNARCFTEAVHVRWCTHGSAPQTVFEFSRGRRVTAIWVVAQTP
jgi:hypothetical protein